MTRVTHMTRLLLCVFVLIIASNASAAPRLGVEVGGGTVWLSEALAFVGREPTWRLDFNCAATAELDLKPGSSLITGLRYSRLGNDFDHDGSTDPSGQGKPGSTTNLHQYLGVPVLFRWDVPGDSVFLLGGTELLYLMKAASESEYDDGSGSTGEIEYTDEMNRFNMTLVGGMGTAFSVGSHSLEVTVRYSHGMLKSNDNDRSLGWKTREFALTLGFRL